MEQPEKSFSPLPEKPEWLKKLEEESWQAELIISGLAIYGTLQLPATVKWMLDWTLTTVSERLFALMYLFFTYLPIGIYVLIFIFIGHFILRAIWVGLVGLNSVFPRGVNEDSENYSQHFLRRFRADHPDQNQWIHRLDELCSIMFGLGAQIAMMFMAITLDVLIVGVIWYGIDLAFGSTVSTVAGIVFLVLFLLYTFLFLLSNQKKFRDKPLVQKWQYPIYKRVNSVLLHIFARPGAYLAMVFQTNLSMKRYLGMLIFIMIFVFFFFSVNFIGYRFVSFMRPSILTEHFDQPDRLIPEQYANLREGDRRLLSMELKSDVISGAFLRVFVPILGYESAYREPVCGEPDDDDSKAEKRKFFTDCYRQTHRFFINDSLYNDVDLVKYEHPNQGEDGILVMLPTAGLAPGKQLLRVEKIGPKPGEVFRQMQAVFWWAPEEE